MTFSASTKPPCDLVMAGGITSGVIYPKAIWELSRKYSLHNIGGTSVGAIAAALAAAAEYRRAREQTDAGYDVLAGIPQEIGPNLLSLFQPTPQSAPLFNILKAAAEGRTTTSRLGRALLAAVRGYPLAAGAGALAGLAAPHLALALGLKLGLGSRVLLPILGIGTGLTAQVVNGITKELPVTGFGMCTGLTQPGYGTPALTNWLADQIDNVAGRDPAGPPLTFGELEDKKINLRMMTTNISMRRPHRLPFDDAVDWATEFAFSLRDFQQLFPPRVINYLKDKTYDFGCGSNRTQTSDMRGFPTKENCPIVVAARMSLSFPVLISAVRLYAYDFTRPSVEEAYDHRECWFSDGALSSNLPIHLFDKLLTNAPTFAITLEPFEPNKREYEANQAPRIRKAVAFKGSSILPIHEIPRFGQFVVAVLKTARTGQDTLQSTLPQNYKRIVHLGLTSDEGGLNLAMPLDTIKQLADIGSEAGKFAATTFPFDDHRWDRFKSAMVNLQAALEDLHTTCEKPPHDVESFRAFLDRYQKSDDVRKIEEWFREAEKLAKELARLGRELKAHKSVAPPEVTGTELRIVPDG